MRVCQGDLSMKRFSYPVKFISGKIGGRYVGFCADLPEVITLGATPRKALADAAVRVDGAVARRIACGLPIPSPSRAEAGDHLIGLRVATARRAARYLKASRTGAGSRSP
jgi:predicted RNase H-like HicB family nuclease